MTDPLFAALPGRQGPVRRSLDDRVAEVRAGGRILDADLVLVVQSLADRIDDANGARAFRGFVMLTAEYRAARRDLLDVRDDEPAGPDPLEAALAAFNAAEAGHPSGPVPTH